MANLVAGTKAIIISEAGNTAGGFELGETVLIKYNRIDGSRERGRVAFSKLDGQGTGYAHKDNLLPVHEVKKTEGVVNVVKVKLEGAEFEGTVENVLAVIKGLQELTAVKPATAKQFEDVKVTYAQPEPVAVKPTLQDKVGVGTTLIITGNGHKDHGLHPHSFGIGEEVTVLAHTFKGSAEILGETAVRAVNKRGVDFTVHQDHFIVKKKKLKPEVGMLAVIKDGAGNKNCLHDFNDGDLVEITHIDGNKRLPLHVKKTSDTGSRGYANVNELDLLF